MAYLNQACGDDKELINEVCLLLAADIEAAVFFGTPLLDVRVLITSTSDHQQAAAEPSKRVDASRHPPSPTAGRLSPGTELLGRYRIAGILGQGGMGQVYRAEDLKLRIHVALKFLPDSFEDDPAAVARFLDEARLARTVTHPNVCRVHDIGEFAGLPFLSMEYVSGENLASLLHRVGRLTAEKVVEIGCQLAWGLAAIHRQGVLHRDLKPANILLDNSGQIRIADFGIALRRREAAVTPLIGSPAYMAPEVLLGAEASVRSDLYAFGLVLYELVTGFRPFVGGSVAELLEARCDLPPIDPGEHAPTLNSDVEKIILKCLRPDPALRPESARVVAATLAGRFSTHQKTALRTLVAGRTGTSVPEALVEHHAKLVERLRANYQGEWLHSGSPGFEATTRFLISFPGPRQALVFCFDYLLTLTSWETTNRFVESARIGVHLAEIPSPNLEAEMPTPALTAMACRATESLSALCRGQILVTRPVFDLARYSAFEEPLSLNLSWRTQGHHEVAGFAEPIEIFAVGFEDHAPLTPPDAFPAVQHMTSQRPLRTWLPGPGQDIPRHSRWRLERQLCRERSEESWIASHVKTGERRLFRFTEEASQIRLYQQEITLFRYLREELGERQDIAKILDWNFDATPFFVESEYTGDGDLTEWASSEGGLSTVPLGKRLEIISRVATTLQAIHSVGILHRDLKPANILISQDVGGATMVRLSGFARGLKPCFESIGRENPIGGSAERRSDDPPLAADALLYLAPELAEGKAATTHSDLYALGALLYQMIVGDLERALAPGWRADISDALLAKNLTEVIAREPRDRLSADQLADCLRSLVASRDSRETQSREKTPQKPIYRNLFRRWSPWSK